MNSSNSFQELEQMRNLEVLQSRNYQLKQTIARLRKENQVHRNNYQYLKQQLKHLTDFLETHTKVFHQLFVDTKSALQTVNIPAVEIESLLEIIDNENSDIFEGEVERQDLEERCEPLESRIPIKEGNVLEENLDSPGKKLYVSLDRLSVEEIERYFSKETNNDLQKEDTNSLILESAFEPSEAALSPKSLKLATMNKLGLIPTVKSPPSNDSRTNSRRLRSSNSSKNEKKSSNGSTDSDRLKNVQNKKEEQKDSSVKKTGVRKRPGRTSEASPKVVNKRKISEKVEAKENEDDVKNKGTKKAARSRVVKQGSTTEKAKGGRPRKWLAKKEELQKCLEMTKQPN